MTTSIGTAPASVTVAVTVGDRDGALNHFAPAMQGLYHDIYTALYDDLPAIAGAMQPIELVETGENHARYRIRKEENYSGDTRTANPCVRSWSVSVLPARS